MNQLEIKNGFIKFVINNGSAQGNNNVKIKLNLKIEKPAETTVLFFVK